MNFSPKLLFPIGIIAVVGIALVFYVGSSNTNEAATATPSMTPTPSPSATPIVHLKTFSDEKIGLTFTYPSNFDLEQSPYVAGKEYIVIDPFNSDPETRSMKESAGLLGFKFLEGTTLEKEAADYSNPENQLERVIVQDVTINGMPAKRISYTAPIGLSGLSTLVQWNNSILQISYYSGNPLDMAFEDIIKSVKNTKR
jgi:hypothetical protein